MLLIAGLVLFYGVLMLVPRLPWSGLTTIRRLAPFYHSVRAALIDPRLASVLLALGLASHFRMLVYTAVFSSAFSIDVPFAAIVVLVPPTNVLSVLPISIASWGVREGWFVAVLSLLGVASGDALLLSLAVGLTQLAEGLLGGIVWIASGIRQAPRSRLK